MLLKLVSWNVNGLRALIKKPEWDWLLKSDAQIVNLQETKAHVEQLPAEITNRPGWTSYWDSSRVKKGYSGVAVFSQLQPDLVTAELPDPRFQGEGRLLHLEFPQFHLFNGYFPNGGAALVNEDGQPTGGFKRLDYKMGFFDAFLELAIACKRTKPVIICGDFNIAHREIDLANPEENAAISGFLPVERNWLDKFLEAGFVDTFRHAHGDAEGQYTWWSYQRRARARNLGWRLDYFFVSGNLADKIKDAWIYQDVGGSDHCPIGLDLEI